MSLFSIDTDIVDNVADDINSLSPKVSSIKSSVSGYDVSNDDGFDFSGAKDAISHNIEGIETKINNTVKLLNAVVGTHAGLQNSVSDNNSSSSPTTSSSSSYNYYPSSSGGSGYYGESSTTSGTTNYGGGSSNSSKSKKKSKKAKKGKVVQTINDPNHILDYNPVSALAKEDLSAADMLKKELGATATTATSAVSALLASSLNDKTTANTLNSTITPEEIITKSQGQSIIVLETNSKDNSSYKQLVEEVATENGLSFNLLMLDSIIESKQTINGLNINISNIIESNTKSEDNNKEEKQTELENKEEEKPTELDNNKEEELDTEKEIKEETSTEPTTDITEEQGKENKEQDLPYNVLNEKSYNTLLSIPTAGTTKNDLTKTPITLIVRNGIIIYSTNGITTKEVLNKAIKELGISNKSDVK